MSVPKKALEQLEAMEQQVVNSETIVNEEVQQNVESDQQGITSETHPQIEALQKELELERQRSASMKGRIDSQLKRSNEENKELKSQLDELSAQFSEIQDANKEPGFKRNLTAEEVEEVGEEVLELQERVIKGTLTEELESGSIKELVTKLVDQSIVARSEQEKKITQNKEWFWSNVEEHYPNAKAINSGDQNWFKFLETFDPNTGKKYRDVGAQAVQEGDVFSLVDLLKKYKPITDHVQSSVSAVAPMPEKTGTNVIPSQPEPFSISQAEVKKFYSDVGKGKYLNKVKQRQEFEDKIMEAAQTGRIY